VLGVYLGEGGVSAKKRKYHKTTRGRLKAFALEWGKKESSKKDGRITKLKRGRKLREIENWDQSKVSKSISDGIRGNPRLRLVCNKTEDVTKGIGKSKKGCTPQKARVYASSRKQTKGENKTASARYSVRKKSYQGEDRN